AEDLSEVDLSVAQRTETARPVDPIQIPAINTGTPARTEFGILHVKCSHTLVIEIEKSQIIELLQNHVARIVQNVGAFVIADSSQKSLEGCAIVEIFAGMQFEARIDAGFFECVQDRQPAAAQFAECLVDETCRPLRKRIKKRPCKRTRKCCLRGQ